MAEKWEPKEPNFNPLFPYGKRLEFETVPANPNDFNPLFPYGKRHAQALKVPGLYKFQSTLPIREET